MMRRAHYRLLATVVLSTVGTGLALAGASAQAGAAAAPHSRVIAPPPFPKELALLGFATATEATARFGPRSFNPLDGYPTATATRTWTPAYSPNGEPLLAGVYNATTDTGKPILLYCADAQSATVPGVHYQVSRSKTAVTPNLGYVGTIVTRNYPATSEPSSLASAADKAAAVQLAIWFFTNGLVVEPTDRHRAAVAAIVADTLERGPLSNAGAPDMTVSGPRRGHPGRIYGPITITGATGDVLVSTSRGQLYADAAGRRPIANGSVVSPTTRLYVKAPGLGHVKISVRGTALVPAGSEVVYVPAVARRGVRAQIAVYQAMVMASMTQQDTAEGFDTEVVSAPTKRSANDTSADTTATGAGTGTEAEANAEAEAEYEAEVHNGTALAATPAGGTPVTAMLVASGLLIGLGTLAVAATVRRRRPATGPRRD